MHKRPALDNLINVYSLGGGSGDEAIMKKVSGVTCMARELLWIRCLQQQRIHGACHQVSTTIDHNICKLLRSRLSNL